MARRYEKDGRTELKDLACIKHDDLVAARQRSVPRQEPKSIRKGLCAPSEATDVLVHDSGQTMRNDEHGDTSKAFVDRRCDLCVGSDGQLLFRDHLNTGTHS
jgi:hypothetical protein